MAVTQPTRRRAPVWAQLLPLLIGLQQCAPNAASHSSASKVERSAPTLNATPSVAASAALVAAGSASQAERLVVVMGGDVNLGRETGQSILADAGYDPFRGLQPLWGDADLRFVNLESQLSDQGGETQSPRNRLIFTGPPAGAQVLARAGIDVVSLANNHAWDYGRSAFFETLRNLRAAGVRTAGAGDDSRQAYAPVVFTIAGKSIAWFAVTQVWNQGPIQTHAARQHIAWASYAALRPALLRARAEHDLVFVSYHGGVEYESAPTAATQRFVGRLMRLGVDAVIGHHPHVIQGVGWYAGNPAFYSLGNLVFGPRPEHPWTRYGMLVKLAFGPGTERRVSVCPYRVHGQEPAPLAAELTGEREQFLEHLRSCSTWLGGSVVSAASDERGCHEVSAPTARLGEPRVALTDAVRPHLP